MELLLNECQKPLYFLSGIYNLDGNRKVFSQSFDLEGVNHAGVGSEAHEPAVDGGSCELLRVGLRDNPFIERPPVMFIAFPDVDSQLKSVFYVHRSFPEKIGGGVAEPYGDKAKDCMADDIPAGEPQLSVPQQVHRFVAERRERGKSPQ